MELAITEAAAGPWAQLVEETEEWASLVSGKRARLATRYPIRPPIP